MDLDLVLVVAALVLAGVAQMQARGQSLVAWAVILLGVAMLPLNL